MVRPIHGRERYVRRVSGYTDKEATVQLAAELERKAERLHSGLGDPYEGGKVLPLKDHLQGFRRHLESKANSEKHVNQTCGRVERVLDGCRFRQWTDISPSSVLDWLADQARSREDGNQNEQSLSGCGKGVLQLDDEGRESPDESDNTSPGVERRT